MNGKKYRFLIEVEDSQISAVGEAMKQAGVEFDPRRDIFYLGADNWEVEVFTAADLEELATLANKFLEERPRETRRLRADTGTVTMDDREALLRFYQLDVEFRHAATTSVSDIDADALDELQRRTPGVFQ